MSNKDYKRPPAAEAPELVVVGSHAPALVVRVNRVPVAGETVMGWGYEEPVDGGKGSNQAIAAARLGARVAFVGCVGQDRHGDLAESLLKDAGVETAFLKRSATPTVGGFVILRSDGVPAIVATLGANAEVSKLDVDTALAKLTGVRMLLTQFEINPEVALYAARRAKERGLMTIINPAPAPEMEVAGLEAADVLTPNESEALALLGRRPDENMDTDHIARELRHRTGAGCVIVTLGERGVVASDEMGTWRVAAPTVSAVDTTGAGDAFNGALAAGLLQGRSMRDAVRWACLAAAYSVTQPGTIPYYPTPQQVEDFAHQAIGLPPTP
jgi:ribokinase